MGIIKRENVADFNAPRDTNIDTISEICICLGEQIAILEKDKKKKSFAHDWTIDVELKELARTLYKEWTNDSNITEKYVSEFVANKVRNMQIAHEAELNKIRNEMIDYYCKKYNRKIEKGYKIRLNIAQVGVTCEQNISNDVFVYNGFGWEEVSY